MIKVTGTLRQLLPFGIFESEHCGTYGNPTPPKVIWTDSFSGTTGIKIDPETGEIEAWTGWCDEELELLVKLAKAGLVAIVN